MSRRIWQFGLRISWHCAFEGVVVERRHSFEESAIANTGKTMELNDEIILAVFEMFLKNPP
jgi:hypothetical protein